jgi:hypothetical protein
VAVAGPAQFETMFGIADVKPDTAVEAELIGFLNRYVNGPTTYSWEWDRHDVAAAGPVAWLLAEGTETATSADHVERRRTG